MHSFICKTRLIWQGHKFLKCGPYAFALHGFMDVHFLKDLITLLNGLLKNLRTPD